MGEVRIYEEGLEEHPGSGIVVGNLLMILWIALGTVSCWFLSPIVAGGYVAVALVMVFVVLRKLVCTKCYYYGKRCPIGWGKLASLFFRQGRIEDFDSSIGVKLAPIVYGILALVPLVCMVVSMVQEFTVPKIVVLAALLALSAYSGGIGRKRACRKCRMRLACPGCAAKVE